MSVRAAKAISAACFGLVAVALLVIAGSPATGYEVSIYSGTPLLAWVSLALAVAGGVTLIVRGAFAREGEGDGWWRMGLAVVCLSTFVLTALPALRGYLTGRADILSHVGYGVDIMTTGHLSAENFYPIAHILTAQIAEICDVSVITAMNYLGPLFSVLSVVFIYMLASAVLPDRRWALVATASAAVLLLLNDNVYARPVALSFLVLPLLFLLYFKASGVGAPLSYKVAFIVMLFLLPFLHPFVTVMFIASLVLLELSKLLYALVVGRRATVGQRSPRPQVSLVPPLICMGTFLTWLMPFAMFGSATVAVAAWFSGEAISNPTADMLATLGKLDMSMWGNLLMVLKLSGQQLLFMGLSLVAVVMVVRRVRSAADGRDMRGLFMLSGWISAMCLVIAVGYFSPGVSAIFSWDRVMRSTIMITPVFVGFVLYQALGRASRSAVLNVAAIVLVITSVAVVGILNLHRSPYIAQPTLQVTQMEMTGWEWFFESKEQSVPTTSHITPARRFGDAILGRDTSMQRRDIVENYAFEGRAPDHFNYTVYDTLGQSYTIDRYMVVSEYDRSVYTDVWTQMARFTEADFAQLGDDPSVARLYSNGDLDCWMITAAPVEGET